MKIKELRLGNKISIFAPEMNEIITVSEITETLVNNLHGENELIPIEITKQWFYQLGFNTNTDEGDELTKNGFDVIELNSGNFELLNHGFPVKIEYVHQLQNLYFALTGNELDYA